jgi:twitching motility two-component system response regulator PilH
MKKILLVEDDAVVVEIYRKKFMREGFQVEVAEDGLVAMKVLPQFMPDLVVLDLMMPKFNGADVLKFIRSQPALKALKVVIFSNAYMTDLALAAAKTGADASLLKSSCTPGQLVSVVKTLLEGGVIAAEKAPAAEAPAAPVAAPAPAPAPAAPTASAAPAPIANPVAPVIKSVSVDTARPFELRPATPEAAETTETRARREFLKNATATVTALRELFTIFARPDEPQFRPLRLQDLHRRMHFFADHAQVAGCHRISHLATAIEALLFELQERPKNVNPSTLQTIQNSLEFAGELASQLEPDGEQSVPATHLLAVLVVDDEPLANRALVHALSRANVKPSSTDSSAKALELIGKNHYDLLLLDYLMPGMDGLELYRRVRALPQYQHTPVIFVTSATDFKQRAQEILNQGNDVIVKPILPIELAVKSLCLLLKQQLAGKK